MSSFLVTGAAGFIGSHLAEALVAAGHQVLAVDAFIDNYPRSWKERNIAPLRDVADWHPHELDVAHGRIAELVEASDGVFHLAAMPGVRESWGPPFEAYVRHNILATQHIVHAALLAKRRVVFSSSSSVYGDGPEYPWRETAELRPISPYGVTKLACEQLIGAYVKIGLDAVVLRYFSVYGPRQRPDMAITRMLVALLSDTEFHILGDGSQARDLTYVDDIVRATQLAMEAADRGTVYNVGAGVATSVADVVRGLEHLSNRRLRTRLSSPASGDPPRTESDSSRIRSDLGWSPRTELVDGLRHQLRWAQGLVAATPGVSDDSVSVT